MKAEDMTRAKFLLGSRYTRIEEDETGYLRVYDDVRVEDAVKYLYDNGVVVNEVCKDKIGLEEYYIDLMKGGK